MGHMWETTPSSIKQGSWCPTCAGTKTISDMHLAARERGGKCLSKKYINNKTKLRWECSKEHQWDALPSNVLNKGSWCRVCTTKKNSDSRRATIEEMNDFAHARKGKCLSEFYASTHSKLKWECSKGHVWEAVPSSIKSGTWCPKCARDKR